MSSSDSVSLYQKSQPYQFEFLNLFSQNNFDCQVVGDKCFHPQLGLIDPPSGKEVQAKKGTISDGKVDESVPLKTLNALETDILDCREKEYFDIYCGKAQKQAKPKGFEVWIDTSSSMRNSDYAVNPKTCYRKNFIKSLKRACGAQTFSTFVYASNKKQLGSLNTLCYNTEQNNPERFRQWIEQSEAKYLLIITDVDEMSLQLRDLLDSLGAKIHGVEDRFIGAKNLNDFIPQLTKTCQKFKP